MTSPEATLLSPEAPRVSIALPVYNGEPYLAQTLADLRAQSFTDWEAVICDNASTDGTGALLREAASGDPRIRVVRNARNLGALPNANRAVALGRAPLACLWGHDDRHHPDFLAALVGALDAAPEAVLAYGDSTLIGPDGEPFVWHPAARHFTDASGHVYNYDRGLERPLAGGPVERFREALAATNIDAPIHGVFRRDTLDRLGPVTINGSDRLQVAHAALLGAFAYVPRALFGYRMHPGSTYFMGADEWIRRETGGTASARSGLKTLARYIAAPLTTPLGARQRLAGTAAALAHGIRQTPLAALGATRPAAPEAASGEGRVEARWGWLSDTGNM